MADNKTVTITIEVDGVKKVVNGIEDAEKAMKDLGKETKKVAQENSILAKGKQAFADMKAGIKGATAGFKGLRGAIAATGIGALIIALTSLFAYFKNTEEGSRKLAIATEALGIIFGKLTDFAASLGEKIISVFTDPKQAILDLKNFIVENITNRIQSLIATFGFLGSAIKKVFSRDFSGALEDAKKAGSSYVDTLTGVKDTINKVGEAAVEFGTTVVRETKAAVEAATNLVDTFRAIRDQQQSLIVENAELNKELETQQRIAEDTTRSYEERKEALERVGEAQVKLAENLQKQAKLEENRIRQQIAQEGNYKKREALETSLAEATAARINAETALETKKLEVSKITTELDLEEVDRKKSINDLINGLNAEAIENEWTKYYAELEIQRQAAEDELKSYRATAEEKAKVDDLFNKKKEKLDKEKKKFDAKMLKAEKDQQIAIAGQTFGAIADLLGKNSAAGKAAATAAALINTYQGITAELATKTVTPFEIGLKIANVATIAAIGFKSVKDILSTPVPGGGGGGGGSAGASMSVPTAPNVDPTVALQAGADADAGDTEIVLGQNAGSTQSTVRAYVVSDEMTTQQEADAKINDLARL